MLSGPADSAKPSRIVSLNLCIDQLVLDLVGRDRIAALSHLAADPLLSPRAGETHGIPLVRAAAEEILALNPDLVLAGTYLASPTIDLLQRIGVRVVTVPMASSIAQTRAAIRAVGDATGDPDRADRLVAEFDRRIAAVRRPAPEARPAAIAVEVNSLVSGMGSLLDDVLDAAGYRNMAREAESKGWLGRGGRLPLETLITSPPDLLVYSNAASDYRTVLADNLRHPALRALAGRVASVHLPMRSWLCGTASIADTVEHLAAQRVLTVGPNNGAP